MTKLMEQCLYIIHRKQRWIALSRFIKVTHIDDYWAMIYTICIHILVADIIHPCTWTLACAWEVVRIKNTYQTSISISHLKRFNFRVIHGHTLQLLKVDTKQLMRQLECAIAYIVELKIRFQLLLIQIIFGLT